VTPNPTAQIYHVSGRQPLPLLASMAHSRISGRVGGSTWSRMSRLTFATGEPTCLRARATLWCPIRRSGNLLLRQWRFNVAIRSSIARAAGGELPPQDPADPNRRTWTLAAGFLSLADEALYYSNSVCIPDRDRGKTWAKISPDLARPAIPTCRRHSTRSLAKGYRPGNDGSVRRCLYHRPVSTRCEDHVVGTDDGLIHVSRDDGASWQDVTPPAMTAWSKVSQIEAGHFDVQTAYASVDRHRLADDHPYIYRTHDGGKTWQNVIDGIPVGAFVNSVKEDTQQRGLLYAATELRVYVSFNDGDSWRPLQFNMPVTLSATLSCMGTILP